MAENIKEMNPEMTTEQQENTNPAVQEKKGFKAAWNGLKTWQKVVIIGTGATAIVVGGKFIYDLVTDKPEVVAEAATVIADQAKDNIVEMRAVV